MTVPFPQAIKGVLVCAGGLAALAACSRETSEAPAVAESGVTAPNTVAPATTPASQPADGGTGIPAAAYGRWALVPADCTSTAGDAKGLLVIDASGLKFYEARAKLGNVKERDASRIRASFAFSGEGQEWTQEVLLDVQAGGSKLIRRDYGPDAMPGALEYARCEDSEAR